MPKPNILWICSDQQRWDTLGCYGNQFVNTPNLDRLAHTGAFFENAFSQSPVCTPSRGSFLTGRYPRTCRARQNGTDIPAEEVLVTKMLADDGYVCGLSGKLHLSACNPSWCKSTERRIDDGYTDFHWSHDTGSGWGTQNEYYAWLKEKHGTVYEASPHPDCKYVKIGMPEEQHLTTWCIDKANEFIEAHQDAPWLFSMNMYDPHHPFDPPEAYLDRYLERLDDIPLPNYVEGELTDKPAYQAYDHESAYGHNAGMPYDTMTDNDHRMVKAAYWAMGDVIDTQVGRVLKTLEETGQLENTIVIFTSDHGEMLGDHGIYLKGPYFYEGAVHVPLIISWPGTIQSQDIADLVELVDLPQTLLDAVGMPHHPGMQGKSIWPLLTGNADTAPHRSDAYCEYYNAMPWHTAPTAQTTMVRTERYKLVVDHAGNTGELYDLAEDLNETRNLWADRNYVDVKVEMMTRLCHRMAWTADPLPVRHADW